MNTVFVKRRPTGEIYDAELRQPLSRPGLDADPPALVVGMRAGFNRLGDVDTMRRYIYIHGSPDSAAMGTPGSIGCIRMHNRDLLELFDLVEPGTPVEITESAA